MKKIFVISLLFLLSKNSYSQPQPGGTFIFTMICKDGILLCADSRGSWHNYDSAGNINFYAHLDSSKKIFKLGKFYVGLAGHDSNGNVFYEDLFEKYNEKFAPIGSIEKTFYSFKGYLNDSLKLTDSSIFLSQFFMVGYEKDTPKILYKSADTTIAINTLRRFSVGIRTSKYFNPDTPYYCSRMIPLIEDMYSKIENDEIHIGGPINIIQVNPDNTFIEVKSFKFKKYENPIQFLTDILNDKLQVVYHYKGAKEQLRIIIEDYLSGNNPFYRLSNN